MCVWGGVFLHDICWALEMIFDFWTKTIMLNICLYLRTGKENKIIFEESIQRKAVSNSEGEFFQRLNSVKGQVLQKVMSCNEFQ